MEKKTDQPKKTRGKSTNLDFVALVQSNTKKGWTIDQAYKMVEYLKKNMKADYKALSKITGISSSGCQFMFKEMKAANQAGMTLEQYFAKGRPFRYGKKVLA